VWAVLAVGIALLPLTPGLSTSRLFYIRDLSLYFWGRYLWLRHSWLAGEFPLWDPYVGGGQAAVADGLHQMFHLPAAIVRLLGNDVLGFNLWIAVPFPLAALGMWLFLSRRFSAAAAPLGAVAFALCGPVYSTSNFPNMSWTVAAIPWMLWSADQLTASPSARGLALLAIVTALQSLSGEPVTQFATLILVPAFALWVGAMDLVWRERCQRMAWVISGLVLGLIVSAVQLAPMVEAAAHSARSQALRTSLFWSLHPMALLETVAPHVYGDYYTAQSLASIPWVPVLNSGREPFFFSVYFGVPMLALSAAGVFAGSRRVWSMFWLSAGIAALCGALGTYTPVYPFLRDHVSVLASFRFPAKYFVVAALAVAALAASGWDGLGAAARVRRVSLWGRARRTADGEGAIGVERRGATRKHEAARLVAVWFPLAIAVAASVVSVCCVYFAMPTARWLFEIARSLGSADPVGAAAFMLKALPGQTLTLLVPSLLTALIVGADVGRRSAKHLARAALFMLVAADLVVRAWPVNPVFDASRLGEPAWLAQAKADPDRRFYVGGKRDGTLDATDVHASPGYLNPPGLVGSASRAALSGQAAFYPSAWRGRELLSYDLAVLWPRSFGKVSREFFENAVPAERDRFLDRTGVRFRILPKTMANGHEPVVAVPYFVDGDLYDWGTEVTSRVSVVPHARIVKDPEVQARALFDPLWDAGTVLVTRDTQPVGRGAPPAEPAARISSETSNRIVVEAAAGVDGGYLLMLDSYASGWDARVDDEPAEIVQANGLFRAVHLGPGRHVVAFAYRPAAVQWGSLVSLMGIVVVAVLVVIPARRRNDRAWKRLDHLIGLDDLDAALPPTRRSA